MKVALYGRVSTRRQEREATIESQLANLLAYAKAEGYDIPSERQFVDQAVSGDQLKRPALDRLRDEAVNGQVDRLICLSPDRLARRLVHQQVLLDELARRGVSVIFLDQPPIGDTAEEQLYLHIRGAFAEYERTLISERMRRGKEHRLRQGQMVSHQTPYGYQYQAGRVGQGSCWLVVSSEAAIVRQLFHWYTSETVSLSQLAQRLNQQGTPSPAGHKWSSTTVKRLLCQPAYKGQAYYNRTASDRSEIGLPRKQGPGRLLFPRYRERPFAEWILMEVPALVTAEQWQAAQERLEMNARFAKRNSQQPYLLRGLLTCDVCGRTLQGRRQKEHLYYYCPYGQSKRPPGVPVHRRSLRADQVEPLIWASLADLLRQPAQLQVAWEQLCQTQQQPPNQINQWETRQKSLQQERERLLNAYQADLISMAELTQRQNPIQAELQTLAHQLAQAKPVQRHQPSLAEFTQQIERALSTQDVETQQQVIRLLIEQIIVSEDILEIVHIVPLTDDSRLHDVCRDT
jgi:site-specific DNA recombinase